MTKAFLVQVILNYVIVECAFFTNWCTLRGDYR